MTDQPNESPFEFGAPLCREERVDIGLIAVLDDLDVPIEYRRVLQIAAADGGREALSDSGVWLWEGDDWAILLNRDGERASATYPVWGTLNLMPYTAAVFRVGYCCGIVDDDECEFIEVPGTDRDDLFVEEMTQILRSKGADVDTRRRGDA